MHTYKVQKNLPVQFLVFTALILLLAVVSYERARVWSTPVALWSDVSGKSPALARAANNAGDALIAGQRFADAIPYLLRAVEADSRQIEPHYNLGIAYLKTRDMVSALPHFQEVLKINASLQGGHFGYETRFDIIVGTEATLGNLYSLRGQMDKAIYHYKGALALSPELSSIRFNLAQAYQRSGKTELAVSELEEMLRLNPSDRGARRAILQLKNQ